VKACMVSWIRFVVCFQKLGWLKPLLVCRCVCVCAPLCVSVLSGATTVYMTQSIMPHHANTLGITFGGQVRGRGGGRGGGALGREGGAGGFWERGEWGGGGSSAVLRASFVAARYHNGDGKWLHVHWI
jgi:hypothetical protein